MKKTIFLINLLCFFLFPLFCMAESIIDWEIPERKRKLNPHYENCQDIDLSFINLQSNKNTSTQNSFCFNCSIQKAVPELKEITNLNKTAFKEKLRKRAIGQTLFKLDQTKTFIHCLKSDEGFFDVKNKKCSKINRELISSIKEKYPKMRLQLALGTPPINEKRILPDFGTWINTQPSHLIHSLKRLKPLTVKEKQKAKKMYVETLASVLNEPSSTRLKKKLYSGIGFRFFSGEVGLTLDEQHQLMKAKKDLHKKAKDSYFQILSELPVLGYLNIEDPDKKDMYISQALERLTKQDVHKAFKKMEDELYDQLKELADPEVYMGSLLAFETLVEELLLENKAYCLEAEKARLQVSKDELKSDMKFLVASVLAAVPCFGGGPITMSLCVAAGTVIAVGGIHMMHTARKKALGRVLTGSEFETMARVYEQDKEIFVEKVLLPLAIWGDTTALLKVLRRSINIKSIGQRFIRKAKNTLNHQKDLPEDIIEDSTRAMNHTVSEITSIEPNDVSIARIGHNTDTNTDVFEVQIISPDNKEVRFDLEIPSDLLERDTIRQKRRWEMVRLGIIDAKDVVSLQEFVQEIVAKMPKENFQEVGRITLEELRLMAETHVREIAFEKALQYYGRHSNAGRSKLISIGPENVHIEEISITDIHNSELKKRYNVWFETNTGKRITMELRIYTNEHSMSLVELAYLLKHDAILLSDLDIVQKMQIAIGQMPAEIFKGLKSIDIHSLIYGKQENFFTLGQVLEVDNEHFVLVNTIGDKKKPINLYKYRLSEVYPHLMINPHVVKNWRRITRSGPSRMSLISNRLGEIGTKDMDLVGVLAHELAHVMDVKRFGSTSDGYGKRLRWRHAIIRDGTSVSEYGDTNPVEDFAEAMRIYIQTDGGTRDPQILQDFANRFKIIDKLMRKSMQERTSLFKRFIKALEERGIALVTRAGVLTHVIVEDHVYIILPEEENIYPL